MKFLLPFFLLFYTPIYASYTAKSLKIKDYEEMRTLLSQYIKKSREKAPVEAEDLAGSDEAILELKKGLKVLFMRPDTDNINSSLLLIIQNEIGNHQAFMPVFREMVEKSVQEFKSKTGSISYQASLLYLIENAISYLQSINTKESTEILTNIKQAQLKISKKLSNYLILEMDRGKTANPSYLAKRVLVKRLKENKQAEEKAKRIEAEEKAKQAQAEAEVKERAPSSEKAKSSVKPTVKIELQ